MDGNGPSIGHGILCIDEQVQKNLTAQIHIGAMDWNIRLNLFL